MWKRAGCDIIQVVRLKSFIKSIALKVATMEQYIENKNQLLGDLYALRAGMSAISVEKDKLD